MILNEAFFERLITKAWKAEFSGWNFSYISNRMRESPPSWDYSQLVGKRMQNTSALLDLDTGGGELLASLAPLPPFTCATEAYALNISLARARLAPLGVQVFDTQAGGGLPFGSDTFDLVIDRHGDMPAPEIARVLKPGGYFLTQQVGAKNNLRLNEMLQEHVEFEFADWTPELAVHQLEQAGLQILDQRQEFPPAAFTDIGAVVYYLKAVPWQVTGFTPQKYYQQLGAIHNIIQETGRFVTQTDRFLIEAHKSHH